MISFRALDVLGARLREYLTALFGPESRTQGDLAVMWREQMGELGCKVSDLSIPSIRLESEHSVSRKRALNPLILPWVTIWSNAT